MRLAFTRLARALAWLAPAALLVPGADGRGQVANGPGAGEGDPRVELEGLDGSVRAVPLEGFSTADPRELGAVFVRYVGLGAPSPVDAAPDELAEVQLHGSGDRLSGAVRAGNGDQLELGIAGGGRVEISIDELAGLVFHGRIDAADAADVVPAPEGDRLYRNRGAGIDRIDGLFQAFEDDGVRFESRLGERVFTWSEIAALFIEDLSDGEPAQVLPGVPVVVDLVGSGRIHGALEQLDAEGCTLRTADRPPLEVPASAIAEVALDDESYRFLSDLPPADLGPVSPTGDDLGMVWPPRMDRARTGEPLRAGGRTWGRGIGVQAPSRIVWELDGEWKSLSGRVAIDDSVLALPRRGSVIFRVHVDGTRRFESPLVRGGDPPVDLGRIDLSGARELVLEVDPATDLWMADRANWLRPILVR